MKPLGVGMGKSLGLSPADPAVFSPGRLAFDAILRAAKSRFLEDAEQAGSRILNGFGMFAARPHGSWNVDRGA
jgi:shikimate 5-dehydrogenase